MKTWKVVLIAAGCALSSASVVAWAAQTNYLGTVFIADTTTPSNQLKVNSDGSINIGSGAQISGFDSGPVSATGTVNSSSHAAGTSVGGLVSVSLARVNGGSGILTSLQWLSPGGSTGQLVLRLWTKTPTSTCTDNTAFANNAADDPFLVPGTPVTITPAAPAVTTGDARTYASLTGLTLDYKNLDSSPGQNLYACLVTVSTDTADESSSPRLTLSGPQN